MPAALSAGRPAVVRALRAVTDAVRRYHRLEVRVVAEPPDRPCLVVANHGFGGLVDLNVYAAFAALDEAGVTRPVTPLVHSLAWRVGIGPLVEAAGGRPASLDSALAAFDAGHHVLVLPGGDLDGAKSFRDRDRIVFGNRRGFARLAMRAGVPVVPVVTAGAGESLFVISDGQRVARALGIDRLLRQKTLPISVSVPWGLSVGIPALLPYLPLPTKLVSVVLPAMEPRPDESAQGFGDRVEQAMQRSLTQLTEHRRLLIG